MNFYDRIGRASARAATAANVAGARDAPRMEQKWKGLPTRLTDADPKAKQEPCQCCGTPVPRGARLVQDPAPVMGGAWVLPDHLDAGLTAATGYR